MMSAAVTGTGPLGDGDSTFVLWDPVFPAVCVRGGLLAVLDGEGHPVEYQVLGASPVED